MRYKVHTGVFNAVETATILGDGCKAFQNVKEGTEHVYFDSELDLFDVAEALKLKLGYAPTFSEVSNARN